MVVTKRERNGVDHADGRVAYDPGSEVGVEGRVPSPSGFGDRPYSRSEDAFGASPKRKVRRILLVEDNEDDEILALLALRRNGSTEEITVVRDGAEALDFLLSGSGESGNNAQSPDLILLDLKLPKVDGFEVLRRLRSEEATRYLPIVVLTSSKEEQDLTRCYDLGANSYVRKPINFDQFTRTVEQLKSYWLAVNEGPHPAI